MPRIGMRRIAAGACGAALLAAWGSGGPAHAAFPGRDGRLMWVESAYEGGDLFGPASKEFFVFQRRAQGERLQEDGGQQCDTANVGNLCPFWDPSFSPDGEQVLFEAGRALDPDAPFPPPGGPLPARRPVLGLVDADDDGFGRDAPLPDLTDADRDPAWSPDGRRIVFSGEVGGNRDLYSVAVDGSGLQRLTDDPAVEHDPAWSVRGEIAFVRGSVLHVVRPDGTGLRRLGRRGRRPDWSPSGSRLVFTRRGRMYTIGRLGGQQRRLRKRQSISWGLMV